MSEIHIHEMTGNGAVLEVEPVVKVCEKLEFGKMSLPHPSPIPRPIPIPWPFLFGSRFLIWKQDPSVGIFGRRISFISGLLLNGPRDARINTELLGSTPVVRNISGDFIVTDPNAPEADCTHSFAVVRQTLTMFERALGGLKIPWAWNTSSNTSVLTVHPRAFNGANAFYSRNQRSLKFGQFLPTGQSNQVFTCRSLDIVAHETGHAVLDGLKPGWLGFGNPPQTGGLHESFGDLTSIFLALSQLDQVETFIAMTKANLHAKNFLAAVAEQFGSVLGRPMGLRNADNNLKLSQVSNEVHAISQVFTGGIYDVLADIFAFEKMRQRVSKSAAHVLLDVGEHLLKLLLNAIIKSPDLGATYSDVVNNMLQISHDQGDPAVYRTFIRNRFSYREVVVSTAPLAIEAMQSGQMIYDDPDFTGGKDDLKLKACFPDHPSIRGVQDRAGTCGTMQMPEYARDQRVLDADLEDLRRSNEPISEESLLLDEVAELSEAFSK